MSTKPHSRHFRVLSLLTACVFAAPAFGQVASLPFEDGFESGSLAPYWSVNIPQGLGYASVSSADGPATGNFHLVMAASTDLVESTAEAILALDLEGQSDIILEFSQREYGDESDIEDGVFISDDGVKWFKAVDLGASSTSVYKEWSLSLDDQVAVAGMTFTNPFYIKFSWNDDYNIPTDGFGFDDIRLRSVNYKTLQSIPGKTVNGEFGRSMAPVGDFDGDGFPDFAVGYPGWNANKGRVEICSGLDASILAVATSGSLGARFGETMANIGDLDGDGKDELLIGAPFAGTLAAEGGAAFVYSYATGLFLHTINGTEVGGHLGASVSGVSDLNGDLVPDFLVGEPFADNGASVNVGRALAYSGQSGGVLFSRFGVQANENFGSSVAGTPDVNGDLIPDVIVGAPGRSLIIFLNDHVGSADVLSGVSGSIIRTFSGDTANGKFGASVLGIADANGDGLGDVAIGAPDAGTGAGMVRIFSPDKFQVIDTLLDSAVSGHFGFVLNHVGDVTGDGLENFAVGSNSSGIGSATVYRASDLVKIYRFDSLLAGTGFGQTVAGAGDINNDGVGDVMIGAPTEVVTGKTNAGFVRIVTTANAPVFELVDGVHSTLSGDLVIRGQSLLANLVVEIDGLVYPSVYVSPVEARVSVGPALKGGYSDIKISTDLGEDSEVGGVPRFPALKSDAWLSIGGQLNVTLNNGDIGSFILATSNQIFAAPADFSNFGWYYGLELAGVWIVGAGGFGPGDFERNFSFSGPTTSGLIGTDFYLQAWTAQNSLGLVGFSNTTKFTIVP